MNEPMTRASLIDYLSEHHFLWSYDPSSLHKLPDKILIEHTLLYADVPQLRYLFELFPKATIEQVWKETLLPVPEYRKLNYYLALIYFDIEDPNPLLNQYAQNASRLRKLQGIAGEHP
jgi:hypothetical protein